MIWKFIFGQAISIVFPESLKTFSRLQNLRVFNIELSQNFFVPADVVNFIENLNKVNYNAIDDNCSNCCRVNAT